MKNIIDYARSQKQHFSDVKFNAVDSLILSQFAYLYFDDLLPSNSNEKEAISIREIARAKNHTSLLTNVMLRKSNQKLLRALSISPRFRDTKLAFYVNHIDLKLEKQFSAITYLLDDETAYIAYRGTDSTFVGWKEDFNMAYLSPIPSQTEGVQYLNKVGNLLPYNLKIGGHSKGGNIAVYSSIKCAPSIQKRITQIYSHDGPGFLEGILESTGYLRIKDRIHNTIPQSSVVGMLLKHSESYSTVKSKQIGIFQHNPFSWQIQGNDFKYVQTVKNSALFKNRTLNSWLGTLDHKNRELFVDTLFQIIEASGAKTFYDLTEDQKEKAVSMLEAIKDIDDETKEFLQNTILSLFKRLYFR